MGRTALYTRASTVGGLSCDCEVQANSATPSVIKSWKLNRLKLSKIYKIYWDVNWTIYNKLILHFDMEDTVNYYDTMRRFLHQIDKI